MDAVKRFSPAVFGLIIFCFVLPFVNLTCSGQTVMTLTGFQLITGRDFEPNMFNEKGMFGDQQEMQDPAASKDGVEPQPMALLAFITAVLCLLISFVKKKITALVCMILSVLGGLFLLLSLIHISEPTRPY